MSSSPRLSAPLIDIGANVLDAQFAGVYHGKTKHAADLDAVLERGWSAGVVKVIVTAGRYGRCMYLFL